MGLIIAGIKGLIIIIIGTVYLPLNMLLNWYAPFVMGYWKDRDYVMIILSGLLFLPLWGITALLSGPYELLVESAAH